MYLDCCWQFFPLERERGRPTFVCSFPVFGNPLSVHAFFTGSDSVIPFTMHFVSFKAPRYYIMVSSPVLGRASVSLPPFPPAFFFFLPKYNFSWKEVEVLVENFYFLFGIHKHYISPKQNSFNSVEHVLSTFSLWDIVMNIRNTNMATAGSHPLSRL